MKVLITGGVRSGKSRHGESMFKDREVNYVAPGPTPEVDCDADWVARIKAHQARRPAAWTTVETVEVDSVLASSDRAVLIDCLGTWLSAIIDRAQAWERPSEEVLALVEAELAALVVALAESSQDVVLVTNEVGLGIVPEHRSGRIFRDMLGVVNQRVAEVCDEVHLVIAGRVLRL